MPKIPRTKIPLYIILLTYVNQAHAHAPQSEAGDEADVDVDAREGEGEGEEAGVGQGSGAKRVGDDDEDDDVAVGLTAGLAGRVKGINSNSIHKASWQCDKVKSLFEGHTDNHGNNLIGIKAGLAAGEAREDDDDFETRVGQPLPAVVR